MNFDTSQKCQEISNESIQAVKYKDLRDREKTSIAPTSSISKPNYEDILRRVSVVIHQHIVACEDRMKRELKLTNRNKHAVTSTTSSSSTTSTASSTGVTSSSMAGTVSSTTAITDETQIHKLQMEKFSEENFVTAEYVYHFIRQPILKQGFVYVLKELKQVTLIPPLAIVHEFLVKIFFDAKLSAECSIVCLIYVERLMEYAHVPLLACTWRPCLLCGLLLASKVWQDISSWNSEISSIYPQFSLQSINRLERTFCEEIKWKLYISSSCYAKYYYSLRSLTEKKDFRRNYNAMMGVSAPGAQQIAERTGEGIKNFMETVMSRSL